MSENTDQGNGGNGFVKEFQILLTIKAIEQSPKAMSWLRNIVRAVVREELVNLGYAERVK